MKRTLQRNKRKSLKVHGFRSRMKAAKANIGSHVLQKRRAKGRKVLCVSKKV